MMRGQVRLRLSANEIIFGMNPDIVCATEIRNDFFTVTLYDTLGVVE
jgi:hypothetical protein